MKKMLFVFYTFLFPLFAQAQVITTYAGVGCYDCPYTYSGDGGPATLAHLGSFGTMATDNKGNLYISSSSNIRKVDKFGVITNFAGDPIDTGFAGDGGPATLAKLSVLQLCSDKNGNIFFVDVYARRIRKIDTFGIITTIAGTGIGGYSADGTPATVAKLFDTLSAGYTGARDGITIDKYGNVYFEDGFNGYIRKIDTFGILHTFAGNGTGSSTFCCDGMPATAISVGGSAITFDYLDNMFLNFDEWILKIDTAGIVHTIAGNGTFTYGTGDGGPATAATLDGANTQFVFDGDNNLYFGGSINYNKVRKINKTGIINAFAGNGIHGYSGDGGPATAASFGGELKEGITVDHAGHLFVFDSYNGCIRMVTIPDYRPQPIGGNVQSIALCVNTTFSLDTVLAVIDSDTAQTLVWSPLLMPVHGVLAFNYTTPSTGGLVTPSGLTYTPALGFAGNDTFMAIISDGIKPDTVTIYITVKPLPLAGNICGSAGVCTGTLTTLSDTAAGGTWAMSNTNATVSGGIVHAVSAGMDTAFYTVTNSCGADTARYPVTIFPLPDAGIISGRDSVCIGKKDTLTETVTGSWSIANFRATIGASGVLTAETSGMDTATYSVITDNGCIATAIFPFTILSKSYCDSVNEVVIFKTNDETVAIYPNPATEFLTVNRNCYDCRKISYVITDMLGREVKRGNLSFNSSELISLKTMEIGIYMISFYKENNISEMKLLVKMNK